MIKVEITTAQVEQKSGVSARTGKSYSIREQEAWFHTCDKTGAPRAHPERGVVVIEDNDRPYPPGVYTICPSSLFMGRFGSPDIRVHLRPVAAAASGHPASSARAA